jgi:ParB family chromosome partitioning protein
MPQAKKGLGRGLSALIPFDDMSFLSRVARGEIETRAINAPAASQIIPTEFASSDSAKANLKTTTEEKTAQRGSEAEATRPIVKRGQSTATRRQTTTSQKDAAGRRIKDDAQSPPAIIQAPSPEAGTSATSNALPPDTEIRWLRPEEVAPNPYQPRRHFDEGELKNLADSIREHGVLQPILVRPVKRPSGGKHSQTSDEGDFSPLPFQLVAGERRWRAAQAAGVTTIPAIVRVVDDQQALELAVIENVQRHDISPLDAALAYRRLADEFQLSQEKIASRVGKSRSAIANTLRLLDLPEEIQQSLNEGALSEGHGRAILLTGTEGARRAVFRAILRDKLSVRDAEELARRTGATESKPPLHDQATDASKTAIGAKTSRVPDFAGADWKIIAEELQRGLGSKVSLFNRKRGGLITIKCTSHEQIERVVKRLRANDAD